MAERDDQQAGADSAPLAVWVDEIADRYEAAWQVVLPPRIADFLGEATGERRAALVAELVQIDRAYRAKVSDRRTPDDYRDELPELAAPATGDVARPTPLPQRVLPAAAVPAGLAIAGYELLGELGLGGMGVVYKARQVGLKRVVALKMMRTGTHASSKELARFRAEMETLARLQHPNIVQIYEVGKQDGQPYCALEYVDGGSLAQKLAGTPQPPRQSAQLVETLARAVQAAHQVGIVHRDLKPANVLLTAEGTDEGTAKITDFGLAKQLSGDAPGEPAAAQTQTGEIVGTPSYMAPEQAEGKPREIGPAADIYALGAILYELLTGRPPFQGETLLDTLEQVRTQEPVPPRRLQPKVPRDLETICLKALAKSPARRYRKAGEMADDLRRFLEGRPILARPVGHAEKTWRWCRRNPVVATLVAALALVFISGFGGVAWQWRRAEARTADARHANDVAGQERSRGEAHLKKAADAMKMFLQTASEVALKPGPPAPEAEPTTLRAIALLEQLVKESNDNSDFKLQLAHGYNTLGIIRKRDGRNEEAREAYGQSLDILEKLLATFPQKTEIRVRLGTGYRNLGMLLRDMKRPPDAQKAFRRAQELFEKLVYDLPSVPHYYSELGQTFQGLASIMNGPGTLAERRDLLEQAVSQQKMAWEKSSQHPPYSATLCGHYYFLANVLIDLKDHQQLSKAASDMASVACRVIDFHTAACLMGCCLPLAAADDRLTEENRRELTEVYASQAVGILREGFKKGYMKLEYLNKGDELASIRSRDDFKKLLTELEQKNKPK